MALGFVVSTVQAQAPAKTPIPVMHTVIATIGSDAITIDTGRATKNYKIDSHTVFYYQGARVTASDIKPGMRVIITPTFDGRTAGTIAASDAPKMTPPAASAK